MLANRNCMAQCELLTQKFVKSRRPICDVIIGESRQVIINVDFENSLLHFLSSSSFSSPATSFIYFDSGLVFIVLF